MGSEKPQIFNVLILKFGSHATVVSKSDNEEAGFSKSFSEAAGIEVR